MGAHLVRPVQGTSATPTLGRACTSPRAAGTGSTSEESYGSVTARRIGKPDRILPGRRAAKQLAGGLSVWGGGTGSDRPEVLKVEVRKGFQGKGLAAAMLRLAHEAKPDLSHSASLSAEGARFAAANPLPNDSPRTKATQQRHLVADASTAMLGGPRRKGYT